MTRKPNKSDKSGFPHHHTTFPLDEEYECNKCDVKITKRYILAKGHLCPKCKKLINHIKKNMIKTLNPKIKPKEKHDKEKTNTTKNQERR